MNTCALSVDEKHFLCVLPIAEVIGNICKTNTFTGLLFLCRICRKYKHTRARDKTESSHPLEILKYMLEVSQHRIKASKHRILRRKTSLRPCGRHFANAPSAEGNSVHPCLYGGLYHGQSARRSAIYVHRSAARHRSPGGQKGEGAVRCCLAGITCRCAGMNGYGEVNAPANQ